MCKREFTQKKKREDVGVTALDEQIEHICRRFQITGEYLRYELVTYGHINTTYKVFFFRDGEIKDYILQKVNTYVFKNPVEVMRNIITVTEHIRAKIKEVKATAKRDVLHYQQTENGEHYLFTCKKEFWRCSRFIDGSKTYLKAKDANMMEEAGRAFGSFQKCLSDYPVESLHIAIPHFHNTVMRFEALKAAVSADSNARVAGVRDIVEEYLKLEEIATEVYKRQKAEILPLRVTHNDTKCSNILFDEETDEHLAVIDLDTVMPGLVAFDFGDAIRAGASTAEEDEKDLSTVAIDMEKYEAFAKGFLAELREDITQAEKDSLALGAIAMTLECGARFLTDYLDGDQYFRTDYEEHNLVRAKNQLALGKDMIERLGEMEQIIKKYS